MPYVLYKRGIIISHNRPVLLFFLLIWVQLALSAKSSVTYAPRSGIRLSKNKQRGSSWKKQAIVGEYVAQMVRPECYVMSLMGFWTKPNCRRDRHFIFIRIPISIWWWCEDFSFRDGARMHVAANWVMAPGCLIFYAWQGQANCFPIDLAHST